MKTKKDLFRESVMEKGFIHYGWLDCFFLLCLIMTGNIWYFLALVFPIPVLLIHYCIGRLFFSIKSYRIEFRFFGKVTEIPIPILL